MQEHCKEGGNGSGGLPASSGRGSVKVGRAEGPGLPDWSGAAAVSAISCRKQGSGRGGCKAKTHKPIFHWKWGSRWVPNANEIYTKNMKYTCPTPAFCVGTQRNQYSTDWRRGLALGLTQILGLASGVWRREMNIFTF